MLFGLVVGKARLFSSSSKPGECLRLLMIHKGFHQKYMEDKIKLLATLGITGPPPNFERVLDPRTMVFYTPYVFRSQYSEESEHVLKFAYNTFYQYNQKKKKDEKTFKIPPKLSRARMKSTA